MILLAALALSQAIPEASGSKADRASLGLKNINRVPARTIQRFGDTFKVKVTPFQLEVMRIPKAFARNFGPVQKDEMRKVARELAGGCNLEDGEFDIWGRFTASLQCPPATSPAGLTLMDQ